MSNREGEKEWRCFCKSIFLQDDDGQLQPTHSISAGLDYPGVRPELTNMARLGRLTFTSTTDDEVLEAFRRMARTDGILPALESSHALAYTMKLAPTLSKDQIIVVNVSGRGDKDLFILAHATHDTKFRDFLFEEVARYEHN